MSEKVKNILNEVQELTRKLAEQHKELVDKLKPSFAEIFNPFLEKYPNVGGFYFTAYAPYFNDGEPCEYSVHDLFWYGVEEEEDYRHAEGGFYGSYYGSLADVAAYVKDGTLPNTDTTAYQCFERQKAYKRRTYERGRGYVETIEYGDQEFSTWFEKQHAEVIAGGLDSILKRAEQDTDFEELRNLFDSIPEDVIRAMFDTDVIVKIDRTGVEVDEYEHD